MPRPSKFDHNDLERIIFARGPVSATDLASELSINRTTVVRSLDDIGEKLVTLGNTRSTRYVLRRQVFTAGNTWPIYRFNENGRADLWATLEALHDRQWRITWPSDTPDWAAQFSDQHGIWEGFPFFLTDVRPQGFLGRIIAQRIARNLGLPDDIRQWSDDHTVQFLLAAGEDVPGAIVMGDDCLRRVQTTNVSLPGETVIGESERSVRYPELAESAMNSEPGSSAGGEQPKFLTTLSKSNSGDPPSFQSVVVKFSPPLDQPTGRRWADLLMCENIALNLLNQHGHAVSGTRIIDAGNRRFLETPRFDRISRGGRRGVVSLAALHPESNMYNQNSAWTTSAESLFNQGRITSETSIAIHQLSAFGELIGNTDKHSGNLSFWLTNSLPFEITPTYDMLPMLWAPGPHGEIVERTFTPAPPLPAARKPWIVAANWAIEFWENVISEPLISEEFRGFAQNASETVIRLKSHEE